MAATAQGAARRARVVVTGAGFGGLFAARALAGAPVDLTIVDRTNHHLFQPLLYQVAVGVLSPEDIAVPIRSILRRRRDVRVLMAEIAGIDLERRVVRLTPDASEIPYDYLVLALGARHAYFGHEGWEARAPGLKTLADALGIRHRLLGAYEAAERVRADGVDLGSASEPVFVVVGGGPTGVELAGALAGIARRVLVREVRAVRPERTRVVLAEAGPRLLPALAPSLSEYTRRRLEALGVEVRLNCAVTALDDAGVTVGTERLPGAIAFWAAGNRASPVGSALGVATAAGGRVSVLPDLSLPGHPEVFVVGDLAGATDERGHLLPALAPVAQQQGRHAAAMIRRRLAGRPTLPFRYRDHGQMATLGRSAAVVQIGPLHVVGLIGWLFWLVVHIATLIGFENRLLVLVHWAAAYWFDRPSARILFDFDGTPPAAAGGAGAGPVVPAAPAGDSRATPRRAPRGRAQSPSGVGR
ncbi:MAG: NAD(P)/FAD-dependent oxidoreductase [Firmicutes bacterium]|nr:NAD(P)/FAD-dependent oxidoreductase [Bacillota bacterium]